MFCENATSDVNSTVNQWHHLPTWNPQAQVMVLLTNMYDEDQVEDEIRLVLTQLLEHGMLNVNVIFRRKDTNILQVRDRLVYLLIHC